MRKIKILFLSSVPDDKQYLEVHRECTAMEDGIRSGRYEALFNLPFERGWNVTVGNLTDVLLKFNSQADIIHFSGHGAKTGIFIDGEKGTAKFISAEVFKSALKNTKVKACLIVLNTCHSDDQAQAIAEIVGCAIGAPDSLPDDLAIQFSASFYRNIAYDFSIREAFELALVDLRLAERDESKYPKLFSRKGLDPSDVYLISRKGRKLIQNLSAWHGFLSILSFGKQIHHMFQTISVMYLPDLFSKLVATGETSVMDNIEKKNELQKRLRCAWELYIKEYESLVNELNSMSPKYEEEIFLALNMLNNLDNNNRDLVSLIKKCKENSIAIIGDPPTRGEFHNYNVHHIKVSDYMVSTRTRELFPKESIVASVQDMQQFANALTVSSDNLIRNIVSILLDSGE